MCVSLPRERCREQRGKAAAAHGPVPPGALSSSPTRPQLEAPGTAYTTRSRADTHPQIYDRLNETFHSFKTLPIEYRLYNLKQLAFMIQDNVEAIYTALNADLSKEPFDIDVGDVSSSANRSVVASAPVTPRGLGRFGGEP